MLSDEEKKAWDRVIIMKNFICCDSDDDYENNEAIQDVEAINTLLNLIEKQQKEIEELKEDRKSYTEEYIHNNPWLYKQLDENYILRTEADKLYNKKWEDKIKELENYYRELYKQDNSPNEFLIRQDCLSKLSVLQEVKQLVLEKE